MSVTFNKSCRLITALNTVILNSQSKCAVAFSIRFNDPNPTVANWQYYTFLQRNATNGLVVYIDNVNETAKTMSLRFYWRMSDNSAVSAYATVLANVTTYFMVCYDATNSANQVLYVNGVPTAMTPASTLNTSSVNQQYVLGLSGSTSPPRNWSLGHMMLWNGYAPTASEALDHLNGTADPTTIGTGATWRGWYKFDGTEGANVADGDAAIGNAIDGTWPFTKTVSGTVVGSSLTYGAAMPFVSQSGHFDPVVCSSGKAIKVISKIVATGDVTTVTAGSATVMPTIKINGGSPITLAYAAYPGTSEGILYYLPTGYKIDAGDVVTLSAPSAWFSTSLGAADAAVDVPCVNRADQPLYSDEPATAIIGYNHTYPLSTDYGNEQGPKNWALRLPFYNWGVNARTFRANGTVDTNFSNAITVVGYPNTIDKTFNPVPLGLWAVSFDAIDVGRATNVTLSCGYAGSCTELTAYRNNGSDGVGIAKVYQVQLEVWPATLAVGINSSVTTLTLNAGDMVYLTDGSKGWLKFDDEYMDVVSINTPAHTVVVTRGSFGTTPASHSAGAGTSSWNRVNPTIAVNITGPGGVPNYENLVIYGPDDWELPEPAAPLVLDRTHLNQVGPTKFVRDSMPTGIGVTRHMDSCGAFYPISEVEQMRNDTDPNWGTIATDLVRFKITTFQPMSPGLVPYIYTHNGDGETYTATLGANVTTAPARWTEEVWTITDAAAAPILPGSRILAGSEWVYVTAVSGTAVTVRRGSRNTTPATHTAGTVTVGWRIPITATSQYRFTSGVTMLCTTDRPHNMRHGVWFPAVDSGDMNPLARVPVTLVSDIAPGDLSITISAADWTYIQRELRLVFGSGLTKDTLRVVTANPATGVVTLKSQALYAHTAGISGLGQAAGVFCVSEDGLSYAWSNANGNAYPVSPTKFVTTFYAYTDAGKTPLMVGSSQTWDVTDAVVSGVNQREVTANWPRSIASWEYAARVTALSPGAYHWVNVNLPASDDFVDEMARRIRDTLPAGQHKVIIELANEVWNYFFAFPGAIQGPARFLGYFTGVASGADGLDWWILHTKQCVDRFKAIFAETGRSSEILLALPYQAQNVGTVLTLARSLGVAVDVCSPTNYVKPGSTTAHTNAVIAADNEQRADLWIFGLEHDRTGQGSRMRTDKTAIAAHRAATSDYPMLVISYEGGVDSAIAVPPNGTDDPSVYTNGREMQLDVCYNPNFYNAYRDYFYVLKKTGDMDGLAIFNYCQVPSPLASGTGLWDEMWGTTHWHGQPAGRGDGSDGKADNRLTLAQPGLPNSKHPLTNIDATNVSVRAQAVIDHNTAYYAEPEPEPTPSTPGLVIVVRPPS